MLFQIFAIVAISCTVSGIKMVANLSEETSFIGALMPGKAPMGVPGVEERQSGCIDVYPSYCPGWSNAGYCIGTYFTWMAENCEKSCGGCGCIDVYPSYCPGWSNAGYCSGTYGTWMAENCEKSCGGCDSMDAPTTCAKIPSWMKSNRIVGGQDAQAPIPWQVYIHVEDGMSMCGGTILDENTILTAAHCFWPEDNIDDYIVAGVTVIDYADEIRVKKVINHPNYNSKTHDNDIAILKLESPLTFNENVKPACLPDSSFIPGHEQSAFVSGWGDMEYDTSTETKTLQFVKVPLLSNCLSNTGITSNMICAGYEDGGKDPCTGDSGGPLVVSGTDDSAIVVGVVSNGFKCALADYPSVYAKVQNYLPWIKNNMN